MQWTPALMALRDVLADLYAKEQDARRILLDAGVAVKYVEFGGSAVNFWTDTLVLVSNKSQVPDLIEEALKKSPRNRGLQAAWQQWLAKQQGFSRQLAAHSHPRASPRLQHSRSVSSLTRPKMR